MSRQWHLVSSIVSPRRRSTDVTARVGSLPAAAAPAGGIPSVAGTEGARPTIRVQTLGAARILVGGQLIGRHTSLLFVLMVRLVYSSGMSVRRAELLDELWPDLSPVRQRGNLRQALYKLRGMGIDASIRGDMVHLDPLQVEPRFAVKPSLECFAQDIMHGAEPYGVFLPGFLPPTAQLGDWLEQTREEVHADVRRVLVDVLRQRRDRADWNGAQMIAKWILQIDALNEDATLALAECIAVTGSKVEAIAVLDRYLTELGANAGDIRLPATLLRKRFSEAVPRRRSVALVTDRYFVGRDQEMSDLTQAMRRARWRDGSAVLLYGPAGIGKTHVVTELSRIAQLDGHRHVLLECRESIAKQPLVALLEALPELLTAPGAAGCSPESLTVIRQLLGMAAHGEQAAAASPAVDAQTEELTASERLALARRTIRPQSIRHAVVDLMASLSDERPIFLLVEDAHWIDDASWEVLSDIIQRVQEMRVCLVLTSHFATVREERPGRMPTTLGIRRLPPLPLPHLQYLVQAIAEEQSAEVPAAVERWITSGCEGSPLMLRALLEHWLATGAASGVPPTLHSLLAQRIDRLDATAQHTLQAIGLLWKFASLDRIKVVLELPMHELLQALELLELSGCLDTSHAALVITHDLLRQVAMRRMSPLVETALRTTIGGVLEAEYRCTEDKAILLEALMHTERSDRPDVLHRFIGEHAAGLLESGRPAAVLRSIGTLQAAVPSTQRDGTLHRMQVHLESQNGASGRALAMLPAGMDLPADPTTLSTSALDERLAFIACAYRSAPFADPRALSRFAASVVGLKSARIEQRIHAAHTGLTIASNTCDPEIADACYRGLALSEQELLESERTQGLALIYHSVFGSVDAAERLARHIVARAREARPTTTLVVQCGSAGYVFRMIGKHTLASEALVRARELAFEVEAPRLAEYPVWQLAHLAIETGRPSDAVRWSNELRTLASDNDDEAVNRYVHGHFCLLAVTLGDRVEAARHLDQCKRHLPKIAPVRAIAYTMALDLAVRLLDHQWRPSETLIDTAMTHFEQTSRYCASDLLASRLGESLIRLDGHDRAFDLLHEYLHERRRERSAPSASLQRVLDKLKLRAPSHHANVDATSCLPCR
jgi:DNA-binding SARP family transcriptional activator